MSLDQNIIEAIGLLGICSLNELLGEVADRRGEEVVGNYGLLVALRRGTRRLKDEGLIRVRWEVFDPDLSREGRMPVFCLTEDGERRRMARLNLEEAP